MNTDLEERVRKLEHRVSYLLGRVNMPVVKARLKPVKHKRRMQASDQIDAVRDWMRKVVLVRDEDIDKRYLFTNSEGRRFMEFKYFCFKHMRVKAPFRDGQVLLGAVASRTLVRKACETMGLPIIDYPKRVGLTTLCTVIEIPAYGRYPGPDYFECCMTVAERAGYVANVDVMTRPGETSTNRNDAK